MSIRYAGGTIVNATEVAANVSTKNALSDFIKTNLVTAGWTNISGSSGSWVMTSPATASGVTGLQMRVTMDNSATNCLLLKPSRFDGSFLGSGQFILPNTDIRIIANKHQFFVFMPGTTTARSFTAMGVPYVDSTAHTPNPTSVIWAQSNSSSDTSTTVQTTFRSRLGAQDGRCYNNISGDWWEGTPALGNGTQSLVAVQSAIKEQASGMQQWGLSNYYLLYEPLIGWGLTGSGDTAKVAGQLWDSVIASASLTGDSTYTIDSRTYFAITRSNNGSTFFGAAEYAPGTLLVAVT